MPGRKYFGAKKILFDRTFKYMFFAQGMRDIGMIEIDRDNPRKAYESLYRGVDRLKSGALGDPKSAYLVMYPEGTRSKLDNYDMLDFKKGAFMVSKKKDLPIMPIVTVGGKEIMPKRSLKVLSGKIKLHVCEAVYPDDYSGWQEMLYETRQRMEEGVSRLRSNIL